MSSRTYIRRFATAIIIGGALFIFDMHRVSAQPVPVPALSTPQFQQTDLQPLFDAAESSKSDEDWIATVVGGHYALAASWEAAADAQIDSLVAGVTQSDAFNSEAEYRAYLRGELELQKERAFIDWQLAAETAINTRRVEFLAVLKENEARRAGQDADDEIDRARDTSETESEVDALERAWEDEYDRDVDQGYREFQNSLGQIEGEYQNVLNQLAQAEAEFNATSAQIDSYEQTVRDAIDAGASSLEGMLTSSDLFYEENCAGSSCTVDRSTLNAAGLELQTLIGSIRDGLANDVALSTLAQQMNDYLATQRTWTRDRSTYWNDRIHDTVNYTPTTEGAKWEIETQCSRSCSGGTIEICIDLCSDVKIGVNMNPLTRAVLDHQGGDSTNLIAELAPNTALKVNRVLSAGFTGSSNYHIGAWGDEDIWRGGNSGETFDHCMHNGGGILPDAGCGTYNNGLYYLRWAWLITLTSNHEPELEQNLRFNIQYETLDENARSNAQTYQGYSNNLATTLDSWRDEILPAIENWEAQTAAYEANFASWKIEADAQRAQAQTAYENRSAEIMAERDRWLGEMESQYRDQKKEWNALRADLRKREEIADAAERRKIEEAAVNRVGDLFDPRRRATGINGRPAGLGITPISQSFLERSRSNRPTADISRVTNAFNRSILGARNVAAVKEQERRAEALHERAIDRMVERANEQNGIVAQQRNLPKSVTDIDTKMGELRRKMGELQDDVDSPGSVSGRIKTGSLEKEMRKLQDQMIQLQKDRAKALQDDLKNHKDDGFTVERLANGQVRLRRRVSTGSAALRAGGNAENAADYETIDQDQEVLLAPPPSVRLVNGGDLFGNWDLERVEGAIDASKDSYERFSDYHLAKVTTTLDRANEYALDRESAWKQDAQDQADEAVANREFLETIAQSMMGGMNLGESLRSYVNSQTRSKFAGMFAEATGLPAGLIANLLGGQSPKKAFESYVKGELENKMYENIAAATGIDSKLISQLIGAHKAKKAAKKAKKQQQINTALTVVAVAAGPFTGGASLGALAAIQAAQGAAMGAQGGGLKGAIMGAAGGALSAYTQSVSGVKVNLSYSYENGFGASASVGFGGIANLSVGVSQRGGLTAGLGLGFKTAGGGNVGLNLGVSSKPGGNSLSLGYKTDSYAVGANYSESGGASLFAGAALGESGANSAGIGYSRDKGLEAYAQRGSNETGAGRLSYSQEEGFGAEVKNENYSLKTSQKGGTTLALNYKFDKDGTGALDWMNKGSSAGASYNTKTGFKANVNFNLGGQNLSLNYADGQGLTASASVNEKAFAKALGEGGNYGPIPGLDAAIVTTMDDLSSTVDSLALEKQKAFKFKKKKEYLEKRIKKLEAARGGRKISQAELNAIMADPEKLSKALHDVGVQDAKDRGIELNKENKTSRETWLDSFSGVFEDLGRGIGLGQLSDSDGFIDADGIYRQRTCFVAGTLVRTEDGLRRIETIQAGDRVLSWNEESGEVSYNTVAQTFVREAQAIYRVQYADGSVLETTWNHPFFIQNRGWVQAEDLRVGDWSHTAVSIEAIGADAVRAGMAGEVSAGLEIVAIDVEKRAETVYNFEVRNDHTYFVGVANVLVHNAGYTNIAPIYSVDMGASYTVNGRTMTRLPGPGNRYECSRNCQPGVEREIVINMNEGRVIQRVKMLNEDEPRINIYNRGGQPAGHLATDDVAAKNMAIINWNEADRVTVVNGVRFRMRPSEGGTTGSICSTGYQCGTNFNEWARPYAAPGTNLLANTHGGAPNQSGTNGRIWLVTAEAARTSGVREIDVGALNYGVNNSGNPGSHYYGRGMDIKSIVTSSGLRWNFHKAPSEPNNELARADMVDFRNALLRQQGTYMVWGPEKLYGGMFGTPGERYPYAGVDNPYLTRNQNDPVPAGFSPGQLSQAWDHRNHLHVGAGPTYCHLEQQTSERSCPSYNPANPGNVLR